MAVRRRNARAIGALFAAEAGRFVALSAGDALKTGLAARGPGAVELSVSGGPVLAIDFGGGTAKIVRCEAGQITAMTAVTAGARLIAVDGAGRVARLERFGAVHAASAGVAVAVGAGRAPFGGAAGG